MELGGKKLHAVQVGGTLHIFDDTNAPAIRKRIEAALNQGKSATYLDNGARRTEWIDVAPIVDLEKEGSARYEWDATGEKVKCRRTRCVSRDGVVEKTELSTSFRNFDSVFND